MFKVGIDNTIHITRGDTGIINLSLKYNNEDYELKDGDICVMSVKKTVNDTETLIKKELVNNQFIIDPDDTSRLKFGTYKYDIQLTTAKGIVATVVSPKDFVVDAEVTY